MSSTLASHGWALSTVLVERFNLIPPQGSVRPCSALAHPSSGPVRLGLLSAVDPGPDVVQQLLHKERNP